MKNTELNLLSGKIIGACIEVHKHLGPGLFESTYEHFVCWELEQAGIQFVNQQKVPVKYKGTSHDLGYRADIVVEREIIVELKVQTLTKLCYAQLLTYLKILDKPLGLLINFNSLYLADDGIRRVVNHADADIKQYGPAKR